MAAKLLGTAPALANDAATKAYVDAIPGIKAVTTLTGTATATANAFHLVNLGAGLGAQTITLPAAPAQGTMCEFIRQDSNLITSAISIVPGGSDTFLGTNPYVLGGSQTGAKFIYVGTVWVVHEASIGGNLSGYFAQRSLYQTGFNPSIMARDVNGRSQVNDPSAAQDIATKNYVDGAIRSVSANTTANNRDTILASASGGSITITVPVAAGSRVMVKKTDASTNAVIVSCTGTVDGDASATLLGQDTSAVFIGDGTNAQIEAVYGPGSVDSYYEEVNLPAQVLTSSSITTAINLTSAKLLGNHTSAWNLTTGIWTCPVSGVYDWTASNAYTTWVNGSRSAVYLTRNANTTSNAFGQQDIPSNALGRVSCSATKFFTAGDTVKLQLFQNAGVSETVAVGDEAYISAKLVA